MAETSFSADRLRAWTVQLYDEYAQICFSYRVKLRRPILKLDDLGSRWGLWDPETHTLSLHWNLLEKYPWEFVIEILKHEMAHQLVSERHGDVSAHGKEFQDACRQLGVASWASRATAAEMPLPDLKAAPEAPGEARLMERVEKLLRLAQSENEHEALLAMRRVQELYAKYNLENRVLFRPEDWTYAVIHFRKKRVERYQSRIAMILNEHFFVEVVHSRSYDVRDLCEYKTLELLGTRQNVRMAEYVYHFLENQLRSLWNGYRGEKRLGQTAKNSFYLGVLSGFKTKLEAGEKEFDAREKAEGRAGIFLVLKKDAALENYVSHRYPRLTRLGSSRRRHDRTAFQAGEIRGRELNLKKGLEARAHLSGKLLKR